MRVRGRIATPVAVVAALLIVALVAGYATADTGGRVEVPSAPATLTPVGVAKQGPELVLAGVSAPGALRPAATRSSKKKKKATDTPTRTTPTTTAPKAPVKRPSSGKKFDSIG